MAVKLVLRRTNAAPETNTDPSAFTYAFDLPRIVIGRAMGADVCLPFRSVEPRHATITFERGGYLLVLHAAGAAAWVNDRELIAERPKPLRPGDRIRFGPLELTFTTPAASLEITTAERTATLARRLVRMVLDAEGHEHTRPRLTVIDGPDLGRSVDLPLIGTRIVVGRAETATFVLTDADSSREHAEFLRTETGVTVCDLESKNGIFINDQPAASGVLHDRDEVLLGGTLLVFEDPAEVLANTGESDLPDTVPQAAPPPPEPPQVHAPTPVAPPSSSVRLSADLVIYAVAFAILVASSFALAWLLRGK